MAVPSHARRQPGPTDTSAPWDLIVKALGSIAAGIGILGFVTLAGGVILFERLAGAGIPAEEAVAEVPRTELLTVGASQLVPLACVVGVIVLLLWALVEGAHKGNESYRVWLIAAAATAGGLLYFVVTADHAPSGSDILLLLLAVGAGGALGLLVWYRLVSLVSQGAITRRSRFGWFTILIAILIPVEGAMIGWVQSREAPLVAPAVLVESTTSHTVIRGFFIAANSNDVYIAEVEPRKQEPDLAVRDTGRILDIPRGTVTRLSVGSAQPLANARQQWPALVKEIEETFPPGTRFQIGDQGIE